MSKVVRLDNGAREKFIEKHEEGECFPLYDIDNNEVGSLHNVWEEDVAEYPELLGVTHIRVLVSDDGSFEVEAA